MVKRRNLGYFGASMCSLLMLMTALGAISLFHLAGQDSVIAQEEDGGGEDVAIEDVGGGDEGGGDDAGGGDSENDGDAESDSVLVWMFGALGWGYSIVFLGLSFTLVALFVMNLLTARRENVVPIHLVEGFEAHLNEKRYQEAYELAKNDDSFLGQVLSAGLGKLSAGYAQAIEAMQEVGEEENMKLEHRLSYMALIGSVAPMLGLFGTVHGMIDSFRVIANATAAPKPKELAEGISTALFTTLVGLAIAIPAIAAYNILRNRVQRLVLEVGILSEGLMSRFQDVGKKKA